ncbi:MAG: arginine-tRNA-protein transferase [Phaeodactylibacter sp.]|nr:arginine-tRNA-protein transferase [Phaeodactylibacter sp.]
MFAEKHYPEVMIPEELDAYLAKGWYRMGQTIFTTHFLCFGRAFYSAIWIRLPLRGYRFRKSLRKQFRRNQQRFHTKVGPASLNPEKEQIYRRYKTSFPGVLAPSLKDSLLDGEDFNIYNTYEVAVYDSGKLVALSFFDLGKHSAASIMGIYDPAYGKHSLGFYTMLMEIDYCMQRGLQFFYPGYIVPGYPRFDYKLRIGSVEDIQYYDLRTSAWQPYAQLTPSDVPLKMMETRLGEMQKFLIENNFWSQKLYYPLFEANLFGFWHAPYFDYPAFLLCSPRQNTNNYLMAVFDPREESYRLMRCSLFDDLQFYFNEAYTDSFDRRKHFLELVVVEEVLASGSRPAEILQAF